MQVYLIRRLMLFIPTMLLVFTLVFVILRVVPGDPAIAMLSGGAQTEKTFTQEDVDRLRAKLGTDRPLVVNTVIGSGVWVGPGRAVGPDQTILAPTGGVLTRPDPSVEGIFTIENGRLKKL